MCLYTIKSVSAENPLHLDLRGIWQISHWRLCYIDQTFERKLVESTKRHVLHVTYILIQMRTYFMLCSVCTQVGYLASYWNLPYYPEWCRDTKMDYFNTLMRISGSYTSLGQSVLAVMNHYDWHHAMLLSDAGTTPCFYGAQSISVQLDSTASNMTYFKWVLMSNSPSIEDVHDYLTRLRSHARGTDTTVFPPRNIRRMLLFRTRSV
jgi:hypothetical protein